MSNGSGVVMVRTNVKIYAYIQDKHMHIYIHEHIGIYMKIYLEMNLYILRVIYIYRILETTYLYLRYR